MNDAQDQDFSGTNKGNSDALINSGTREQALASGDAGAISKTEKKTTPIYLSGVLWLTIVSLVAMIFPTAKEWLEANPVEVTSVLGAVNVILRFITSGKKKLSGVDDEFAESTGDQDGGADSSAPRASHTSGAGGSALLLMIGMSLVMMTWACSSADKQTAASVALTDGHVVIIRGGSSLVVDRDNHSVSWSQSTPDVVVVPPVVQATGK